MFRRSIASVIVALAVLGCASDSVREDKTTPSDKAVNKIVIVKQQMPCSPIGPRRVMIVGDSEACAVRSQVDSVRNVNDVVVTECEGGTTVGHWGKYGALQRAFQKHPRQDVVVIFLGTNHYWNELSVPDVSPILKQVKENRVSCVWVGNTAVHGRKWAINKMLHDAVVPTCEYFDTEAANIPLWDGVHPDHVAAKRWLELVWQVIPK